MYKMTGPLIILIAIILTAIILRLIYHPHRSDDSHKTDVPDVSDESEICCGQHEVCLKNGKKWIPGIDETLYYDDEELDRFIGIESTQYSETQAEEFREIMLTLSPGEAPGWHESLRMRGINIPEAIRPELDLLIAESLSQS